MNVNHSESINVSTEELAKALKEAAKEAINLSVSTKELMAALSKLK
jgi:hypothetical protein